jgi:hypothetical protein
MTTWIPRKVINSSIDTISSGTFANYLDTGFIFLYGFGIEWDQPSLREEIDSFVASRMVFIRDLEPSYPACTSFWNWPYWCPLPHLRESLKAGEEPSHADRFRPIQIFYNCIRFSFSKTRQISIFSEILLINQSLVQITEHAKLFSVGISIIYRFFLFLQWLKVKIIFIIVFIVIGTD